MNHRNCSRCNAGMPSHRVNDLCEECYAEEWDGDYDAEADEADGNYGSCDNCGSDLTGDDYGELCDQCQWWLEKAGKS